MALSSYKFRLFLKRFQCSTQIHLQSGIKKHLSFLNWLHNFEDLKEKNLYWPKAHPGDTVQHVTVVQLDNRTVIFVVRTHLFYCA